IINDILDVSKIEAGKLELHEDRIDLDVVTEDVLRLVQERAEAAGVSLLRDISGEMPYLYADQRKIKQILLNLISNAIKFTPSGGTVTLSRLLSPDGAIIISVADTGIGIAPENIPIATSRFGQVDSSMTRRYSGTGLGLPLSIGLVQLHQGKLKIESQIGRGTVVSIAMPPERTIPRGRSVHSLAV
ncbi:MAG TPA: ATP-binding protein, partial [Alphaproteobacteria bacterium]|nr:ATP-binding protein [Alphaproteobacteria bacterium]